MSRRTVSATITAALAVGVGFAAAPAIASDDFVTITVTLPNPEGSGGEGTFYRLAGQSAFYTTRTSSSTTGGQLDGLTSDDSFQDISFFEVFPENNLTDYLRFGYFGVLETVVVDGSGQEQVVNQSLVFAGQSGVFDGLTINAAFPFFEESVLVNALVNGFDTPEFFDALFTAFGSDDLLGDLTLFQQTDPNAPTDTLRFGETLVLYALIEGSPGGEDLAVGIGTLSASVLRIVPAPSTLALGALVGLVGARRRRS